MIDHLLASQTAPFSIALAIMVLIALLEGVGMLFGLAFSSLVDSALPDFDVPDLDAPDLDIDADFHGPDFDAPVDVHMDAGPFTRFLGWLSVGRVPVLVLFVAFLTAFGISGLLVQSIARGISGVYLPAIVAVALPSTRYLGLGLARVIPKEETEAVSREEFIGKVAVVTSGTARSGLPAEAKLTDRFGQSHYVRVEPDLDGQIFERGAEVLLVRKTGGTFRVIENVHAALSADPDKTDM